jgi:hypothetical protein
MFNLKPPRHISTLPVISGKPQTEHKMSALPR